MRELAEIGPDPRGGWTRLAFGPEEREAHALFGRWAADLGLRVRTDAIGNTFAELPGEGPALLVGSHLDTVPRGGAYDGAAGIAAALEVGRLLKGSGA
ncbi:M28 family peptidase [Rubrobacter marinus]|uniref:M28 family peptidase n=1 Tax=Rubrobacter marinus TaxID=2653852 RepID=UPI00140748C2|nr:M28 family peptidase [Rubrobacter marinus]